MKKNFFLTLVLALVALFSIETATAQAPVATPQEAITGLLNRIGGNGAADRFEIVIDANLAENGKDVFIIAPGNGKPCIKGNTQLSVATGINWYLNHYAHINLTWNNLTTDLVNATLPVPTQEEKHVCNTTYRYDFNTCTFSYSMAFWTWDRWQKEIDWMALHGINAPLNLVGLDVVTRKFLRELGVSESDINAYIAGPGFIAWFAMNNLEGWGGTINSSSTGVNMNGNPDWWYTRQEQLCRNMLQRMRELGMQPVIPGFSGQVPNCIVNYSIDGFSSGDVVNNGTWAGGYTRPDILKPNTTSYQTFATVYYKHLHEVMGVSELYSIDPFHEGSLPGGVTNETCYPNIMAELDTHFGNVEQSVKDTYKVTKSPSWIIQYWQGVPQSGAFTAMKNAGYTNRFIGLDLFADNIYADNAAKWRTNYYDTCPYIYCMLHNFGGRSGLHGRLETTMDGYFQALAKNNNCQGIGATPEGTETNPILYDMLFELPWMDVNNRPTADAWLADYAYSRYGVDSKTAPAALEALKNLKKSVWDCKVNQQGTSEAVILARPNWTINSVSSWSTSAIYWDTQDVLLAADQLYSVKDIVTANGGQDGIANYNYDFIDVVRQAMVDYAAQLLPLINAAHNSGNNAEYTRLYQLYLQLMLDLDEMLSYDENFKLERWTSLARNIADEVSGTTENDRNWLEWNARTQVTVWSKGNTDLHDYSNRCWAGLIKDFHYKRWKQFFENNGNAFSGGWYSGFEYPWTVDFHESSNLAGEYSQVVIPNDMTATEKAAETFGNYFGRVKGATKNYIFPMGVATNATKSDVIPEVYRGQEVELPLIIGKNVTISSVWVDLNADGNAGNGETLTANGNNVTIPADAAIGKTTAKVTYSDGTIITFNLALIEDITTARTVTAVAGSNGSVAIEGTNELSITTTDAVKITATANTGYNFENWTKGGEVVSNDNPFIYYGKEAAEFTANFIQDKWGVPTEDKSDWGDATVKTSFVNELTFAYYNREPETIYEATVAPDNLFNTISQIINVPQGASFDVTWSDDSNNGLKYCCLSAYIDLNADGDFTDEGELLKVAGTKGAQSTTACEGKINVILPYDAPLGLTHMRLRFDGAWKDAAYNAETKSYDAKAQLNRMCYEVVINVTEKSDKAATINVETNSADWGTVEVWTDETPDGSTGTEWVVSANIPMYLRATKASEDVEFLGWYDQYGRLVTENLEHTMYAREDA
ncbi:MAG: alpha-N-acetylglucosaminidase, partial [Bacteroidaceae bacterium]|nr:alpha-N-acetylglucosaminidase [Bacteroidaceae bacterium]